VKFWNYRRSVASIRLLVEFGQERGVAVHRLLAGSNLTVPRLGDFNAEVSAGQELRVAANLLAACGEPTLLGIQVGQRYHLSTYGIWGFGLIASATLGAALDLALRFLPLTFAYTDIALREAGATATMSFGAPELEPGLKQFLLARDMAAAASLIRELAGADFAASSLCLVEAADRADLAYADMARLFGGPPRFAAQENAFAFDRAFLARALRQANPITASMCEKLCQDLIGHRGAPVTTTETLRRYLDVLDFGAHDLAAAARLVGVSERTLKRRLREEGTSFRTLLAEARKAMAQDLLADGRLTVADVAARLGFGDASSFSQAFKRWHGVAPDIYRRGARDSRPA
jgi:AraC-like DNA-binding protein